MRVVIRSCKAQELQDPVHSEALNCGDNVLRLAPPRALPYFI